MKEVYKICFLGYQELTQMALSYVKEMQLQDTEIMVRDCTPANLKSIIEEAQAQGFEIFIGGGSNYAAFKRMSNMYIQELPVTDIDYLRALRKAEQLGRKPAIVQYKYSRPLDLEVLEQIFGKPIGYIVYEDSSELSDLIHQSEYDVIIGTTFVKDFAIQDSRQYLLAYSGIETIRTAIERARKKAFYLRREQKFGVVNRALMQDTKIGIIITNEDGFITMINSKAEAFLDIAAGSAQGRLLGDISRNLIPKDDKDDESFRIIHNVRLRCTQKPLWLNGRQIGHFTTLRVDNSKISTDNPDSRTTGIESTAYHWHDLIAMSPAIKKTITDGKKISDIPLPVAIVGEQGTHKRLFAECLHSGSSRAGKPLCILNLSTISENDAGRHLLGSSDPIAPHTGLLEKANGGTVILMNLNDANPAVQACIMDAVTYKQITQIGNYQKISLNIRFITIFDTPVDTGRINTGLFSLLTTQQLMVPPIRERREDIVQLFEREINLHLLKPLKITRFKKAMDVLTWYDWHGNLSELQASAARFAFSYVESASDTQIAVFKLVVDSIGKEKIFQQAYELFLASEDNSDSFSKMVDDIGRYVGMTQSEIADQLGIGRTTLWRKMGRK